MNASASKNTWYLIWYDMHTFAVVRLQPDVVWCSQPTRAWQRCRIWWPELLRIGAPKWRKTNSELWMCTKRVLGMTYERLINHTSAMSTRSEVQLKETRQNYNMWGSKLQNNPRNLTRLVNRKINNKHSLRVLPWIWFVWSGRKFFGRFVNIRVSDRVTLTEQKFTPERRRRRRRRGRGAPRRDRPTLHLRFFCSADFGFDSAAAASYPPSGAQFNRQKVGLSFGLKNHLSFGLRFPYTKKKFKNE